MQKLNILHNHQEARERLIEHGYLFLKSFFPKEMIENVRNIIHDTLIQKKWARKNQNTILPIEPVNRINSSAFFECIAALMEKEDIHQPAYHPSLHPFLKSLLNVEVYPHPRKMIRLTYPYTINPKDCIPPHQDLLYVRGEKDTLTIWIPLGNYPPENGGLEVAHGSHRKGIYNVQANDEGRFGCTLADCSDLDFDWRVAHYEPGDILIMHSLTLHRSGKNLSDTFRLSLDCRFSSKSGSINREQLLPPYYPNIPGWDTLSKHWKNPKIFNPPSSLTMEEPDHPLELIMNKPSALE